MIVINPIPITPSDILLADSTLTSEYGLWDKTLAYAAADRVMTEDGRVWESPITSVLKPGQPIELNLNHNPLTDEGFLLPYGSILDPDDYIRPNPTQRTFWWVRVSLGQVIVPEKDNSYRFLYLPMAEQTTTTSGDLVIGLNPRYRFNSVAMFNIEAESATVSYGGFSKTLTTDFPSPLTSQFSRKKELAFLDMPTYTPASGEVTITISNGSGETKCGYLCFGIQNYIGLSLYGTNLTTIDYSHKVRDTFGNIELLKREYSTKINYIVDVPSDKLYQVSRLLSQVRASPAVYIADPKLPETLIVGYFQDFNMPIQPYNFSTISLEVESLV